MFLWLLTSVKYISFSLNYDEWKCINLLAFLLLLRIFVEIFQIYNYFINFKWDYLIKHFFYCLFLFIYLIFFNLKFWNKGIFLLFISSNFIFYHSNQILSNWLFIFKVAILWKSRRNKQSFKHFNVIIKILKKIVFVLISLKKKVKRILLLKRVSWNVLNKMSSIYNIIIN